MVVHPKKNTFCLHWFYLEVEGTKRHKWNGVLQNVNDDDDDKAKMMLIEFAGDFRNQNANKLENDTEKVYRNAARLLNKRNSNELCQPHIFIVSHKITPFILNH